jgi:hypothetical protein
MKIRFLLALAGLALGLALLAFVQQKDAITDPPIFQQLHAIGKN